MWTAEIIGRSTGGSSCRFPSPRSERSPFLAYSNVWDEFLIALTMIKTPDKRTLPIALKLFQGQNLNNWGLIFAASLIAVLPILLIYIVLQKAHPWRGHGRHGKRIKLCGSYTIPWSIARTTRGSSLPGAPAHSAFAATSRYGR